MSTYKALLLLGTMALGACDGAKEEDSGIPISWDDTTPTANCYVDFNPSTIQLGGYAPGTYTVPFDAELICTGADVPLGTKFVVPVEEIGIENLVEPCNPATSVMFFYGTSTKNLEMCFTILDPMEEASKGGECKFGDNTSISINPDLEVAIRTSTLEAYCE